MLLNAAVAAILTALLILTLRSLQHYLYLHYAAVTSAMLLNAAAAIITALLILNIMQLTALLILTLRSLQRYLY